MKLLPAPPGSRVAAVCTAGALASDLLLFRWVRSFSFLSDQVFLFGIDSFTEFCSSHARSCVIIALLGSKSAMIKVCLHSHVDSLACIACAAPHLAPEAILVTSHEGSGCPVTCIWLAHAFLLALKPSWEHAAAHGLCSGLGMCTALIPCTGHGQPWAWAWAPQGVTWAAVLGTSCLVRLHSPGCIFLDHAAVYQRSCGCTLCLGPWFTFGPSSSPAASLLMPQVLCRAAEMELQARRRVAALMHPLNVALDAFCTAFLEQGQPALSSILQSLAHDSSLGQSAVHLSSSGR
jgi:hypothetical protein